MLYKNVEIWGAAELIDNGDGSISWKRVPSFVHNKMESKVADIIVHNSTGVELRFVIKGDSATIRMSTYANNPNSSCSFHVYRGNIQGGYFDHEEHRHITGEVQDFVIKKSYNANRLKTVSQKFAYGFDSEVVRIIFDRGRYRIYDIIGDVVPPNKEQYPKKTLLCYGSSITHGSNALSQSNSWASILAHNLNMDLRNLGMAGSCAIEPEFAEYIASEGEKGNWDVATLELGINVLNWEDEKITNRVENIINTVASRNKSKPIFVISPFYHFGGDFNPNDNAKKWRIMIEEIVKRLNYKNVKYINGFEILDGACYISADEVHPNIYGVARIAEKLTERIGKEINNF